MGWRIVVVSAEEVIIAGPAGEFIYDAAGNLRSANVGQVVADPLQGITCQQGFTTFNGHGAALTYQSTNPSGGGPGAPGPGFFQYQDLGSASQGSLIFSVTSSGGTEPYDGFGYPAGFFGFDPVFGDSLIGTGGRIQLALLTFTQRAVIAVAGSPSDATVSPILQVDAPEQTTAQHAQIKLAGASPDGITRPFGQLLAGNVSGGGSLTPVTDGMLEIQGVAGATDPAEQIVVPAAGQSALAVRTSGDTANRFRITSGLSGANPAIAEGPGTATQDTFYGRIAANKFGFRTCDVDIVTAGRGLRVAEGANAKQGTATLAAGTVVVANTSVTATSRIFLTAQDNNSTGALRVSNRTVGASFTITSSNAADSGLVAYEIYEPG